MPGPWGAWHFPERRRNGTALTKSAVQSRFTCAPPPINTVENPRLCAKQRASWLLPRLSVNRSRGLFRSKSARKRSILALTPKDPASTDKAAKRQAAEQEVFLREVDDALRQDQVEGFYKNYGKAVLAVVVVGLAAFAGFLFWQHQQKTAREQAAEQLVQSIDSLQADKPEDARSQLNPLIEAGHGSNADLARLMQAGIALENKKPDDAVKLYRAVAQNADAPQPLRDLATVREVATRFDTMKPQDVIDRLKSLAAPGSAWFGVAGELVATAYMKQGKNDQAGQLLAAIAKDKTVSASLRSRAGQLAGVLGADSLEKVVDERGQPLDESDKEAETGADGNG